MTFRFNLRFYFRWSRALCLEHGKHPSLSNKLEDRGGEQGSEIAAGADANFIRAPTKLESLANSIQDTGLNEDELLFQ